MRTFVVISIFLAGCSAVGEVRYDEQGSNDRSVEFDVTFDVSEDDPPPARVEIEPGTLGLEGGGYLVAQSATFQYAVPGAVVQDPPRFSIFDAGGLPVSGLSVRFELVNEGALAPFDSTTDLRGELSVSEWRVGKSVGDYGLLAVVGSTSLFFAARTGSSYSIDLRFENDVSDETREAFNSASSRWSGVIQGDLNDVTLDLSDLSNDCSVSDGGVERVDDLLVVVRVFNIDGPGNVIGQAGPCVVRAASGLPLVGIMEFDRADLGVLSADGLLEEAILHEMGHVIGIGTLWTGLVESPSIPNSAGADTRFSGENAVAEYQRLGGTGRVPVENNAQPGSADGHWRESVFANELMSPQLALQDGRLPLSSITVASLEDLGGYEVNYEAADEFVVNGTGFRLKRSAQHVHRLEHRLVVPSQVSDENGQLH